MSMSYINLCNVHRTFSIGVQFSSESLKTRDEVRAPFSKLAATGSSCVDLAGTGDSCMGLSFALWDR